MIQQYALFFDIDGTLVSFKTHEIPPSTIQALVQAKANGSRVYIATGRPPLIITNLGAIEHLIDGYITTNGALCYVGDKLIACQAIPKEDVMTCVEDCQKKGHSLIVIGRKDVAVIDPKGDVDRIFRQMLAVKNLDKASPMDVVLQQDILQLTAFFPADYEPQLMARMTHCVSGRWHPEFTDITANGADKGKGIVAMARHEGFDPSHTIAFGDGGNDTSMILQAGIGIAMGNAIDELKQQADYVTTSVDDDGVLNALRHFQVIPSSDRRQELSILIPVYNSDCRQQVTALSHQAETIEGLRCEIVVADDGSDDVALQGINAELSALPNVRYIRREQNVGRAAIRNYLAHEARYEWLLFMDGDMAIPSDTFLKKWVEADVKEVAYGGYVVGEGSRSSLRFIYEKENEPMHRATERRKRPHQHFHTCNFLIRRDLMLANPFDERFRHYGYEDVLFGKQLNKNDVKIEHVDNPAGFFDFEDNVHFVNKTEEGLRTLHVFRKDLRGYSQMLTFVDGIHLGVVRWCIRCWHRLFGALERRNLCGNSPSLRLFKLYKLGFFLTINEKQ